MNVTTPPQGSLYDRAKQLLNQHPDMGKARLANLLGVKTPTSRLLRERWRGETNGHSQHPDYLRVKQLKDQNPEWGPHKTSQQTGLTVDIAKVHLSRWQGAQAYQTGGGSPSPTPILRDNELEDTVRDGSRDLSYRGTRIQTLEELLRFAKVDQNVWMVERTVLNKYEQACKTPDGNVITTTLFQIKAWLKLKAEENTLREVAGELLQAFSDRAPRLPPIVRSHRGEGMLEIALFDLHYGKLAWGEECGYDYNLELAAKLFWNALEDLLERGSTLKPEKIVFPIGQDFLHTDVLGRTTTAGTPQDSCVTWKQAFVQGWQLLQRGIERLRLVAPVHVPVVNGNHDVMATFHVGEVLKNYNRTASDVIVDNAPAQRKYIAHHKCLLGLTHGNEEKHSQLGILMATERPQEWANSVPQAREYHIGHYHHKRSLRLLPAQDVGGVLVRVIPSLSAQDSWHASKGFVSQRAAEAFHWSPDQGVVATFTHSPN